MSAAYATLGSLELRAECRRLCNERGQVSSWTAYANRETCLKYLERDAVTGIVGAVPETVTPEPASIVPAAKPVNGNGSADAANVLAGLQALIGSALAQAGSVNESRVREIVRETALGSEELSAIVRKLVAESDVTPVIKFQLRDGATFAVSGVSHPITKQLAALLASGIRTWIHGPAGTGKTTVCRKLAEAAGMSIFVQPPSLTRYDVLGYIDAHGKTVETPVSRFVRFDGPKCLILDEVDSWGDGAQLAANLLLANGHVELPDGPLPLVRDLSPMWIVATANTIGKGATSAYVGRKRMDGAFLDRFDAFPLMDLHLPTERKIAKGIIAGCDNATDETRDKATDAIEASFRIRDHVKALGVDLSWSPRKTYALTTMVINGFDTKEAVTVLLGATDKASAIIAAAGL